MFRRNLEPKDGDEAIRAAIPLPWIVAYLGGVLAFFHQYRLLDARFELFLGAICAGFVVHYLTPFRHKQTLFLLISLMSALALLPASFILALLAFGIAFYFALSCIQTRKRQALALVLILSAAALLRSNILPLTAIPRDFWKYFGGLFMFRALIYIHDRVPSEEGLLDCLTYFFVAPSFYFLVFPVIDYRLFRRTYFLRPQDQAALSGVDWIFRGGVQLLVLRIAFHCFFRTPSQVAGPGGLALFCVCAFLSILKITGSYHISIGILHLFGFGLPRPAHNYFLSRNFLDYWNRSNVYWKNFILKMVYMPLFLRFQARGRTAAAVIGCAAAFAATWFLHAYQRFWILGEARFSSVESVYWAIMGGGVMLSLVAGGRATETDRRSWRGLIAMPATFLAMSVLWGFCSMPSLQAWRDLLAKAR